MEKKKKVVYILGPFDRPSGLEHYAAVEEMLTELGYETISPVLIPEGMDAAKSAHIADSMIFASDAVVVLPDWQASKYTAAEHHMAICFDKPMVEVKYGFHSIEHPGAYPPDIVKAWLKYDLEQALREVSA